MLSLIWFAVGWVASARLNINFLGLQNQPLQLITRTYQSLDVRQFPENSSSEEIAYNAINGMITYGPDPHAAFYKGAVAQRFREDFLGNSGTPGLYFAIENSQFVIIELVPDGPAERAGLAIGDQIVAVDGNSIDERTSGDEVAILLRGPLEQEVTIDILRDGSEKQFQFLRQPSLAVAFEILNNDIGYIRHRAFTESASEEFKAALEEIMAQDPKGIIWDLRGNRGGSMVAAQAILSHFIAEGTLFTVELKNGSQRLFEAAGDPLGGDLPLVLLIDERTLSASETSVLAIREHDRGTIIGVTSGGKGTIQDTISLDEDHLIHVTIGKWLSPNGKWIGAGGSGIDPDIEAVDLIETTEDESLQMALRELSSD